MSRFCYDITKHARQRGTASGLNRVAAKLLEALQTEVPVQTVTWKRGLLRSGLREIALPTATAAPVHDDVLCSLNAADVFFTTEIFAPAERPGFVKWWNSRVCQRWAVFYDAIPRKHPEWVRRKSVRRFRAYLRMLSTADRVWAISEESADDLRAAWASLGLPSAPVEVLLCGSDGYDLPRQALAKPPFGPPWRVLQVGSLEPRKRPDLTLAAAEILWQKRFPLFLTFAGRVNEELGAPMAQAIAAAQDAGRDVRLIEKPDDAALLGLYRESHLTVYPSATEGWGLPVAESLWLGRPALAGTIPVSQALRTACAPALSVVESDDPAAWAKAIQQSLGDRRATLPGDAVLPSWQAAAQQLLAQR